MANKKVENVKFQLEKAMAKREYYFEELQKLYELSQNCNDPLNRTSFTNLFRVHEERWEQLIKVIDLENDLKFQLSRDHTPDFSVLKEAEKYRVAILGAHASLNASPTSTRINFPVKLPRIALPEFYGGVLEWPLFYEKFATLIHNNPNLDDLTRLHYLLGALKGEARKAVEGFIPSADNYHLLLDTLKVKFENRRLLAHTYVRQMLDAKPLQDESGDELLAFLTRFDASFKSFKGLKIDHGLEYVMGNVLLTKLDPQTRRQFETSRQDDSIPLYDDLFEFFIAHSKALIQLSQTSKKSKTKTQFQVDNSRLKGIPSKPLVAHVTPRKNTVSDSNKKNSTRCPSCKQSHQLFRCPAFHKLPPHERVQFVKDHRLCQNCLSSCHTLPFCKSTSLCKFCGLSHHSLLHLDGNDEVQAKRESNSESLPTDRPTCSFVSNATSESFSRPKLTLLPTAVVRIVTPRGSGKARFLVDSGSQSHVITESCCKRLQLDYTPKAVPLEGMGRTLIKARGQSLFVVQSIHDPQFRMEIDALVTDTITDQLPQESVDPQDLEFVRHLPLADKSCHRPNQIDGILGAPVFCKILGNQSISDPRHQLLAMQTRLGFIIFGEAHRSIVEKYSLEPRFNINKPPSQFCIFYHKQLMKAVQRFWELEEVPKKVRLTHEEQQCEQVFTTTTSRLPEGRYVVHLPFKEFPPILGNSRDMAERRWRSLERRFQKCPELKEQYSRVIHDYLDQNHMSFVPKDQVSEKFINYIPHFAVFRESSSTPLRVVFDASAKTANGRSLNDSLFTGPKLQKDLSSILTQFRKSPVVLVADIRQMYRNISVAPSHRSFQRILWRNSPQEPLQEYQLNCVMFGLTSAPYLALRVIQQLVRDEKEKFPFAAQIVDHHMYVDDLVVSVETVSEALEAHKQLVGFFKAGGFHITKWISNSPDVLESIPVTDCHPRSVNFEDSSQMIPIIKVLGLQWDAHSDNFSFVTHAFEPTFSKRGILSTIARIWDPLGFLAPVTLHAKLMLKELWSSGVNWDEALPVSIDHRWRQFISELPELQEIQIPRYFRIPLTNPVILVGFADSSEQGYGAVVYLRSQHHELRVNLVCAKSRVASQKFVSLPRLELCAAVLLAQLMNFCTSTLSPHFQIIKEFALTDSSVTLAWIKNSNGKRDTFVAHRVAAIKELVPSENWYHVGSSDNMADCISRGLSPRQFLQNKRWLEGPAWLALDPSLWPIRAEVNKDISASPEPPLAEVQVLTVTAPKPKAQFPIQLLINRSSSWSRLCRILVYVLRLGKKLPLRNRILASDLDVTETYLVRVVQREYFAAEFASLEKDGTTSQALRHLRPFVHDGCLRVGGRLHNAPLSYNQRHPWLLPKRSHLVNLIIDYHHILHLHAGPILLLALLRQRFWILSARSIIRHRVHQCNRCFRIKPRQSAPLMGSLPAERVNPEKPFTHCGVDYAGPFSILMHRRRGARSQKGYICLFVCFTTKAIHLELASDLSTEAFFMCFTRFLARRGPVAVMHSDCGTNFVGAKAKLEAHHELVRNPAFQRIVGDRLAQRKIEWRLNPPSAPHFGGLWESGVKAVKTHIRRTVGAQLLSWEEFSTLLTEIESLLNSRPLTVLSDDPAEPAALTPAHFLNNAPLSNLPLQPSDPNISLKSRKHLVDQITISFWKRWKNEYLSSLQARNRWNSPSNPITIGTVVLVRDDTVPPLNWPLGVVDKVHPGADGVVRVATVRMKNSLFLRPVVKLYPLPSQ